MNKKYPFCLTLFMASLATSSTFQATHLAGPSRARYFIAPNNACHTKEVDAGKLELFCKDEQFYVRRVGETGVISVVFENGWSTKSIDAVPIDKQHRYIHIFSHPNRSSICFIGTLGLKGGGNGASTPSSNEEDEDETTSQKDELFTEKEFHETFSQEDLGLNLSEDDNIYNDTREAFIDESDGVFTGGQFDDLISTFQQDDFLENNDDVFSPDPSQNFSKDEDEDPSSDEDEDPSSDEDEESSSDEDVRHDKSFKKEISSSTSVVSTNKPPSSKKSTGSKNKKTSTYNEVMKKTQGTIRVALGTVAVGSGVLKFASDGIGLKMKCNDLKKSNMDVEIKKIRLEKTKLDLNERKRVEERSKIQHQEWLIREKKRKNDYNNEGN